MATRKPVIVRTASGAEYGFASVTDAKRLHPDGMILRHQDGTAYTPPKKAAPKKTEKKASD